jgi:surface antigen
LTTPAPAGGGSGSSAALAAPAADPPAAAGTAASGSGSTAILAAGASMANRMALRAFLVSPVATRVAQGQSAKTDLAVVSSYNDKSGRPCRIVEQTVTINSQRVRARGTVCEGAAGQWALVP